MREYGMNAVADISEMVDYNEAENVCTMWHSGAFESFNTEVST